MEPALILGFDSQGKYLDGTQLLLREGQISVFEFKFKTGTYLLYFLGIELREVHQSAHILHYGDGL